MKQYKQKSRFDSPWNFKTKVKIFLWDYAWYIFCKWTPKNFNNWRLFVLKIFGTKIIGSPFVHQKSYIHYPWNLVIHHKSCIGDRAVIYALDKIEIEKYAVVAQEAYLCTGTHNFKHKNKPLVTDQILIRENAFIGARAFILPGIIVGKESIVGACSVITKNIPDKHKAVGNPAKINKFE